MLARRNALCYTLNIDTGLVSQINNIKIYMIKDYAISKQEEVTQTILESYEEPQVDIFKKNYSKYAFGGGFGQVEDNTINPNPLGNKNYEY